MYTCDMGTLYYALYFQSLIADIARWYGLSMFLFPGPVAHLFSCLRLFSLSFWLCWPQTQVCPTLSSPRTTGVGQLASFMKMELLILF